MKKKYSLKNFQKKSLKSKIRRNKNYFTILGIFIFGLIFQKISFPVAKKHPTHIDEITVVKVAYNIYKGEYNPEFFRYPAGHMNLLALTFKISEIFADEIKIEDAYLISWFISKIIIAAIPVLIFTICYILSTYSTGVVGSILAIISEIMIQYSQVTVVDIMLSFSCLSFFAVSAFYFKKSDISIRNIIILYFIVCISIAMKYTAAILFLSLFLIIHRFIHQNHRFSGTKYFQIFFTCILGFGFLLIWSTILVKEELVFQELTSLTTDGIIEPEYLNLFDNMFYIALSLDKINGLDTFISPIYLQSIAIAFFGFFLFSQYTIFEVKRSFADFMYEYRHMQIGSAAQYHHQSQEYYSIINNLNKFYPIRFYSKLLLNNFGKVGMLMAIFGTFELMKKEKLIGKILLTFLFFMMFTILSWQNVADRYTLSILPIIYILIPLGINWICVFFDRKVLPYQYSFAILSLATFFEPILRLYNKIG